MPVSLRESLGGGRVCLCVKGKKREKEREREREREREQRGNTIPSYPNHNKCAV
jgi:hypothetical protein